MPKASPIQTNFNSGELSSLLYGRVDSPRYKQGLASCLNYIPTLQGPLTRRPGTKYVTNVKNSTTPPILVPFMFSETQAYMLELGDQYIRFYANGAPVITTGTSYKVTGFLNHTHASIDSYFLYATQADITPPPGYTLNSSASVTAGSLLELQTPYLNASDLSLLRWCQSADTLYLFHPSYAPMKLQRHAQAYWSLETIYLQDGPYLALNSYVTTGDSVATNLSTTSASAYLVSVTTGPSVSISSVSNVAGAIKLTTSSAHGFHVGDKVFVTNVTATVPPSINNDFASIPYWSVSDVSSSTQVTLANSVFSGSYTSSTGTIAPALFSLGDLGRGLALIISGARYWGIIVSTDSASSVTVAFDRDTIPSGSTAATAWQIGVYYPGNYPACGCFHQNRLFMAGAPQAPDQIVGSVTGSFEAFSVSSPADLQVTSDNALQFDLVASDVNAIHWVKSTAQGLLAGTYTNDWAITPSSLSEALTPTNFNAATTSSYGSAQAEAVTMGNGVIYIQRAKRKVRELNYFFQVGTFRSTDLSELSEHITLPAITKLAVQKENLPLVWGIRSDGLLLSLSYDRDDANLRTGWARHQLGGQSDASGTNPIVQSIAVIPSTDLSFDQLWMTVKRWINGASVITVEYMTKVFDQATLQEDAYQFDCGATFDSPLTITAISTASPAVVTSAAHGLANGDQVRIVSVVGLNKKTTDADGNVTTTNLVNEQTFVVASSTTNTFALNDFNGNAVSSTAYAAYVSGGQVRKMVKTISNLTWLENETVSILADGAIHPDVVVSNSGAITLNYRAAKVQIGYSYNSDGQMLRPEAGSADGSSIGKTRRVSRVAVMLNRVGDFLMGMSFTRLLPVKFQQADQVQADQATPLFSGIHRDGVESAYDFEGQFCFRQNTGLPGTVQAVTLVLDEMDV